MARLDAVKADDALPGEIFTRLTDSDSPETLRQIAKSMRLPVGRFVEWFTTKHAELYDVALKVRAADLALDALDAAKGAPRQAVSPEGKPLFDDAGKPILEILDVARDKLRADVALKLAAKFDRDRYGERAASNVAPAQLADAGLLIRCGQLLELASRGELRLEREVRSDTPVLASPAVTLPIKEI